MRKKILLGTTLVVGLMIGVGASFGQVVFRHTITGEELQLAKALDESGETPAVKHFMRSGNNPYMGLPQCFPKGEELYLTACSACHGHYGEGKLGPGLNDSYWTYPKNVTDKGLFETIFGGARGQMGPQYGVLTVDEMLLLMAWIRHLYTGDAVDAEWLTEEQKASFTPFKIPKGGGGMPTAAAAPASDAACEISLP